MSSSETPAAKEIVGSLWNRQAITVEITGAFGFLLCVCVRKRVRERERLGFLACFFDGREFTGRYNTAVAGDE